MKRMCLIGLDRFRPRLLADLWPEALDDLMGEHMVDQAHHSRAFGSLLILECFLRRDDW